MIQAIRNTHTAFTVCERIRTEQHTLIHCNSFRNLIHRNSFHLNSCVCNMTKGKQNPSIGIARSRQPAQDDLSLRKYIADISASSTVTSKGMSEAVTLLNASLVQNLANHTYEALDVKPHEDMEQWAASEDAISAFLPYARSQIFVCWPLPPPTRLTYTWLMQVKCANNTISHCNVYFSRGAGERGGEGIRWYKYHQTLDRVVSDAGTRHVATVEYADLQSANACLELLGVGTQQI